MFSDFKSSCIMNILQNNWIIMSSIYQTPFWLFLGWDYNMCNFYNNNSNKEMWMQTVDILFCGDAWLGFLTLTPALLGNIPFTVHSNLLVCLTTWPTFLGLWLLLVVPNVGSSWLVPGRSIRGGIWGSLMFLDTFQTHLTESWLKIRSFRHKVGFCKILISSR